MDHMLCTEKSFEISWPYSLYVDNPLHKMAFWVNISPHESCLCFLLAWMKMHFWKLKLSHLTWVNEDSLLKAEVVAPYMNEWKCTFESWSCRALHEWMKIRFWKLKLSHLPWVNEDSLLKAEVIAPHVHKFTHIIFSKFTFESWSWCPLWVNENEWRNMHVSNRQKWLCITCDVWNEACLTRENALVYCLCLQRSHKYHISCLPIPWALTL